MKSISLFSAHFSEVWPILFGCIRNWHSPSQYFQRGRFRTCHQHLWCHSAAFSIYRTISDHFGTCWWCSDCSWPCYCSPCRPIAPSAGQQLQSPLRFSSLSWSRQKWTLYSECLAASASPGWFRSWPRPLLSGSFSHGGQNLLLVDVRDRCQVQFWDVRHGVIVRLVARKVVLVQLLLQLLVLLLLG